jgi:cell division protein FtsQ
MRKFQILLIWIGIIAYMVFVTGFVSGKFNEQVCGKISVRIMDSLTSRFITPGDITGILLENESRILGYPLRTINTLELRTLINKESFIKNADVYKTVNGVLNVDVVQRRPILRIINRQGNSYYLDNEGVMLPASGKFTSRVLVANGYISEPFIPGGTRSVFDLDLPADSRDAVVTGLFELASFIAASELWNAQIAQIYVNSKYEFEMIPRVGAHVIYLGDASNIEVKFRKLEALYYYGLNTRAGII